MMKGVWLEDLTWPEAKTRFDADPVVVVPIGAASKAHGPHLPLKTDALTARGSRHPVTLPSDGEETSRAYLASTPEV